MTDPSPAQAVADKIHQSYTNLADGHTGNDWNCSCMDGYCPDRHKADLVKTLTEALTAAETRGREAAQPRRTVSSTECAYQYRCACGRDLSTTWHHPSVCREEFEKGRTEAVEALRKYGKHTQTCHSYAGCHPEGVGRSYCERCQGCGCSHKDCPRTCSCGLDATLRTLGGTA